jgi:hypothetical protein
MNTAIEERIRTRAYELWEGEGRPEGREVDHWLQAAQELAEEKGRSSVAGASRSRKPRSATATAAKRTATTTAASGTRSRSRAPKGTAAPLS